FYRLFDSIEDVLAYECDIIRKETMETVKSKTFENKNDEIIYCIKRWIKNETLIKAIIDNKLIGVLYDSHIRNGEQLKKLYSVYCENDDEFECFVYLLVSLIFAALAIYFQEGSEKSVEEVFSIVCRNAGLVIDTWRDRF
ncbi:MAG: hypothetical protein J6T73_03830, partial [Clostridia bacterium]|nr:hypothetical protein [Clostridia bacterium]